MRPRKKDKLGNNLNADKMSFDSQTGYGVGDVGNPQDQVDAGRDYSSSPGAMAGDMEYGEE